MHENTPLTKQEFRQEMQAIMEPFMKNYTTNAELAEVKESMENTFADFAKMIMDAIAKLSLKIDRVGRNHETRIKRIEDRMVR